jgi:NAD(P)-dependent dehydrogenase (short-subunit alcohol dehydrogenase family)
MKDARVLVVGASAGIGRAFAQAALHGGARVVVAARRADRLASLDGAHPVQADVSDPAGRAAIGAAVAEHLAGLDLVLYAVGRAEPHPVAETGEDAWRTTFETNVVAFDRLVAALLPHLAPGAIVAALSSEGAVHVLPGLVAYSASKAALESAVGGWQVEHPELRFVAVGVGVTQPTEFGVDFDIDTVLPFMKHWQRRGQLPKQPMDTTELASVLVGLFGSALTSPTVRVENISLRPLPDAPA